MTLFENVKGTIVSEETCWESPLEGQATHKVRLDNGKLAIITRGLLDVPPYPDGDDPDEAILSKLFNSLGDGTGHRLEIELSYSNESKSRATIVSVKDLGKDVNFTGNIFRDRGFVDSLPLVGWATGNVIRCE